MKLNLDKEKVLNLVLNSTVELEEIDSKDKVEFINLFGDTLLESAFKNKQYKQLEQLFQNEIIRKNFLNQIKKTISEANISYIENLTGVINLFVLEMSRQNIEEKQNFFNIMTEFCLENPIEMRKFFNLRSNTVASGFENDIPFGMYYLRVAEKDMKELFDKNIISKNLFSLKKKTTLIHYLHYYPYETSKYIIDNVDLTSALKDRDNLTHTPLENLISDLRVKNIEIIDYLFVHKLDLNFFKKELISYIVKGSNILKNKQTKQSLRDRVLESLENIFNLEKIQSNDNLKQEIAKNIANKIVPEIHYLWLNAKFSEKPVVKRLKI